MEAVVFGSLMRLSGSSMNHRSTMGHREATEMATTVYFTSRTSTFTPLVVEA
jgi:hypothetical protein